MISTFLITSFLLLSASVEALSTALSNWGGKDGAIIVVSHDKSFCDSVGFNAVGTVDNGELIIEERDLNANDWKRYDMASQQLLGADGLSQQEDARELTPEEKEEEKRKRKRAFNAPKRIQKIEQLIDENEKNMVQIDADMMEVGNDVGKLTDLSQEKEVLDMKVAELMEEWEELETLLEELRAQ